MSAFIDFLVRLLGDLFRMPLIFIEQVLLPNPISFVIVGVGTIFILLSVGAMAYFALGALGVSLPHIGRGPGRRIE